MESIGKLFKWVVIGLDSSKVIDSSVIINLKLYNLEVCCVIGK